MFSVTVITDRGRAKTLWKSGRNREKKSKKKNNKKCEAVKMPEKDVRKGC